MDRVDSGGLLATNNPVVADVERNAAAVASAGSQFSSPFW
jgi:hypothetical protein